MGEFRDEGSEAPQNKTKPARQKFQTQLINLKKYCIIEKGKTTEKIDVEGFKSLSN